MACGGGSLCSRRIALVATTVWMVMLLDGALLCQALSTAPEDGHQNAHTAKQGVVSLDATEPSSEPETDPARLSFAQVIAKTQKHVCGGSKNGLFCSLVQSLRSKYMSSATADFVTLLRKMHGHFCSSTAAQSSERCKLMHLLSVSVPPAKIHAQASIDGSPMVDIDDTVDVNIIGDKEKTIFSPEERKYLSTVRKISGEICDGQAETFLCSISQGFEKHYRQAVASGDNGPYVSFVKQTQGYYCGGDKLVLIQEEPSKESEAAKHATTSRDAQADIEVKADNEAKPEGETSTEAPGTEAPDMEACNMLPLLLASVPPRAEPEKRGTAKILGFLKVLDASVKWYCKNSNSLFCHLSTGLKQTYLESINVRNPKQFVDYVTKIESHYCAAHSAGQSRCKIYELLRKGLPDLVNQDLFVKGLSKLPPVPKVTTGQLFPTDASQLNKHRAAFRKAVSRKVDGRRAPGEGTTGADMGEVQAAGSNHYQQALKLMRDHYCKTSDQALCSKIQHLHDEYEHGAAKNDLSAYKKLLFSETSTFCNGDKAHETRCKAFTLISEKLPSAPAEKSELTHASDHSSDPAMKTKVYFLEQLSCTGKKNMSVFCQLARGLNQVYQKEAGSSRFFGLLADIKGHYCAHDSIDKAPQEGCDVMKQLLQEFSKDKDNKVD